MKTPRSLTRSLLITALLLGIAWTFWPTTGEALSTDTGDGEEWVLTNAALQRTAAGDCANMQGLQTCRELCINGMPTGEFGCFAY